MNQRRDGPKIIRFIRRSKVREVKFAFLRKYSNEDEPFRYEQIGTGYAMDKEHELAAEIPRLEVIAKIKNLVKRLGIIAKLLN